MKKQDFDKIDKSVYSEKSLSLLNIRELRDMGRMLGVPSPTTKSKNELVEYILKIVYGEVEASERSVYGRPNVREFNMNRYLAKIKNKTILKPEDLMLSHDNMAYEMVLSSPSDDYDMGELIEQRVFVEENGRCFVRRHAFIESEDDIELTEEYAKKFKLENLDMLEIVLSKNSFKIISINGVKTENKFDGLNINGEKVKGGIPNIFHCSTKEEIKNSITSLKDSAKLQNLKMYIFSAETYVDDFLKVISFSEKDGASVIYKKFMQFIGLCEKTALESDDFVMVIDGADIIESLLKTFEEDVCERIKKHLHETISKIVSLGNVLCVYRLDQNITY